MRTTPTWLAILLWPAFASGAPPLFSIEILHSTLQFKATHVGFGSVRGTFKTYRGVIDFEQDDISKTKIAITVDVNSIDSGDEGRDGVLRQHFFSADSFPVIQFMSTRIEHRQGGYHAIGLLKVRNVSREIDVPFSTLSTGSVDQFKHERIAFAGEVTINRNDFGVIYRGNKFWNGVVSEVIEIEFELSAIRYNALGTIFPFRQNSIGKMTIDAYQNGGITAAENKARTVWAEKKPDHDLSFFQMRRACLHLVQSGNQKDACRLAEFTLSLYSDTASPTEQADLYALIAEFSANKSLVQSALSRALKIDPFNPGALLLQAAFRR